jgi:pilus assembly protein Flp/PilA
MFRDRRGVTAIEYALLASLIAVVIIVAVASIGPELNVIFNKVSTEL